ncbi:MAG TPA: hypothetical protein VLU99_07910 [Nitrososphaerales archaeon]|nr:hypothetical protein [Nitrososphaerales archaeon]HUK75703.1 hypothetical protein [Nitrososphaerales archaeon]
MREGPTTSRRQRPRGSRPSPPPEKPLKSIRIVVTLSEGEEEAVRGALAKGLTVEDQAGKKAIVISSTDPDDALAKLDALGDALSSKT